MKTALKLAVVLAVALLALAFVPSREERMASEARDFLASLTPELRAKAAFDFDDPAREDWHFVPRERKGVRLGDLSKEQRAALDALIASAMSGKGIEKVEGVFGLERILYERESHSAVRDPGNYAACVFGEPGVSKPWGWKIEGHHLSLNFSSAGGTEIAVTPRFFGAAPLEVPDWKEKGVTFRVLGSEEVAARALLAALSPEQRKVAVRAGKPPDEVVLLPGAKASSLEPEGIAAKALDERQRKLLDALVAELASGLRDDLAAREVERAKAADPKDLRFLWIGTSGVTEPFYFRVHGPGFVIEYENGRPGADHVHLVWRDATNDFGADLLRRHVREEHGR